ncbi:MAG: SDR family oxidoreductase [Chloroflexi bacterium]|nr:SDR family oxidoreductase [Chloroflexota bacterium]
MGKNIQDIFGYEGKTVVISGAASGMAKSAAELLIDLGAKVYAMDLNDIHLPVERAFKADLSKKETIDAICEELPEKIDALFLCHGMAAWPGKEIKVQLVNYFGQKYMIEKLLPRIVDNGSISCISSVGGFNWQDVVTECMEVIHCATFEEAIAWYEAHPELINNSYMFSKQCLNTYIRSHAHTPQYTGRRIRLNAICPGHTLTGLTEDFAITATGDKETGAAAVDMIFLGSWNGRPALPEEMGYPLVAIGSKIFSYMSGQTIYIDYGLTASWEIDTLI